MLLKLYAGLTAIQLSKESHQYKFFEIKSKAICPNAVDFPLNWFVNWTDEFCQTEKLGNTYIEFPIAVKMTLSFGSDAMLKMSESVGVILRVVLL